MSRVSLGIILPGDPKQVQKQNIFIQIMTFICRWGFIPITLINIFVFISAFSKNSGNLLITGGKMLVLTGVFYLLRLLWGNTVRCPYCHHFMNLRKISSSKMISSYSKGISRTVSDIHSGMAFDLKGNTAYYSGTSFHRENGTETTEDYTYNMYCEKCGCVHKVKESRTKTSF